jgi:hypothetical protein
MMGTSHPITHSSGPPEREKLEQLTKAINMMKNQDEIFFDTVNQRAQYIVLVAKLAKNAYNEHEKALLQERLTTMIYQMAEYTKTYCLALSRINDDEW